MKRKIIGGVLAAVVLACGFAVAACTNGKPEKSEHEWGDEYTMTAAYAKAAELGYTGTLEEFIASISGKDGKDGTDGTDGEDGVGIKSVTVNAAGELVVTDTNDRVIYKGKLPACDHVYSDWQTVITADCRTAGYDYRTCLKCGDLDYYVTPIFAHGWDNGTVVYKAECIKNGLLLYTCENCGDTRTEIIPATGEHVFVDGTCKYCNMGKAKIIDERYNGDYGYKYFGTMPDGENLQSLYADIDNEVIKFHNDATAAASQLEFNYGKYGLNIDQAISVWKTYLDDKPLYYWMGRSARVISDGKFAIDIESEYTNGAVRTAYNDELYELIEEYSAVAEGESAYSVAFAYHDMIIENIDYARDENSQPEGAAWAHNITGVFEGKGAVCEGYARAFNLLLNMRGVENVFVTGQGGREAHAWNLVKLDDGKWYWYDLTFDDTPNSYWGISHTYFCATDESFLKSHTADSSEGEGVQFLYELPERATAKYAGKEIKYDDSFWSSGTQYTVVGYDEINVKLITSGGRCVIPESVKYKKRDLTVTSIMNYTRDFEYSVLQNETKFVSVDIPSTVKFIYAEALRSDYKNELEEINVDENNQVYRSVDGVLFTKSLHTLISYPNGSKRTYYAIPDETKIISHLAFESRNLEILKIGKSVRRAGFLNWWGAGYPDSDDDIGFNWAAGEWGRICNYHYWNLRLEVDEDNPNYTIKDGMLFNKSLTYLYVAMYDIEEAVLPDTVTSMEENAFDYCRNLKSVSLPENLQRLGSFSHTALESLIIPDGISRIEYLTFCGCRSLTYLEIPASVTFIGRDLFHYSTAVKTIKYLGTVEQWENDVTKEGDWGYSSGSITVVCTDGTINY
ncbi:MAG: leucine-rich repeat protein [Clostridia bacterium]|nr:leucine-rich repeat protein [Clostridia bacterium]